MEPVDPPLPAAGLESCPSWAPQEAGRQGSHEKEERKGHLHRKLQRFFVSTYQLLYEKKDLGRANVAGIFRFFLCVLCVGRWALQHSAIFVYISYYCSKGEDCKAHFGSCVWHEFGTALTIKFWRIRLERTQQNSNDSCLSLYAIIVNRCTDKTSYGGKTSRGKRS